MASRATAETSAGLPGGHEMTCMALLGTRAAEIWLRDVFSAARISVTILEPGSVEQGVRLLQQHPVALIVLDAPLLDDHHGTLSSMMDVRCIGFPPVLALVSQQTSPVQRERLRLAGVVAIADLNDAPADSAQLVTKLARSPRWFHAPIGQVASAAVLQTLDRRRGALLFTAACPHWKGLATAPWSSLTRSYCHGSPADVSCEGWFGRIYVADGTILRAETPIATGIEAVAQILELSAGELRLQQTMIAPECSPLGPVHDCILEAAAAAEDWGYDETAEFWSAERADAPGCATVDLSARFGQDDGEEDLLDDETSFSELLYTGEVTIKRGGG